jgi:nitroreductase
MVTQAALAILICGDLSLEKYAGFWVQDCSAAMQNLLLAAHDKGLGAVWTGIYPVNDRVVNFKSIFGLPEQVVPLMTSHPTQSHSAAGPSSECPPLNSSV